MLVGSHSLGTVQVMLSIAHSLLAEVRLWLTILSCSHLVLRLPVENCVDWVLSEMPQVFFILVTFSAI